MRHLDGAGHLFSWPSAHFSARRQCMRFGGMLPRSSSPAGGANQVICEVQRSELGHNPNSSSALARPVPPGADLVGESGPLVKLAHAAGVELKGDAFGSSARRITGAILST